MASEEDRVRKAGESHERILGLPEEEPDAGD